MLDLLDYRRRVFELYRTVRLAPDPEAAAKDFRRARDELFKHHPQSALSNAQRASFESLNYYPYDPAWRVWGVLTPLDQPQEYELDIGEDGRCRLTGLAQVSFTTPNGDGTLTLYWIEGYGGGLFLPFRDATGVREPHDGRTDGGKTYNSKTYGGGRYLYDTIKGADLGGPTLIDGQQSFMLDFNFAYNPSCAYNARWVCPLAPPANHLPFAVPVGEQLPPR